ncbi:MAG: YfcC family protein [Clostridia bacterium]|nr:YfcC family protein [Clostridia bacterium]
MAKEKDKGIGISARSFVTALLVIFVLMAAAYALTFVIPGGEYARVTDESGNTVIDTEGGFTYVSGGIAFWKWALSPFLVLGAEGGGTIIAVIAFLLVVGGVFTGLQDGGLMKYMLWRTANRFAGVRYRLMALIVLLFMGMGALIGSFEECVPLVPLVVALAVSLGWDALTGMGMSLLAVGCGFASGVCNPFTVGVAQELAGLPMFSGVWLRAVSFALIYGLLMLFLIVRAKKIQKPLENLSADGEFKVEKSMDRALVCFCAVLGAGIVLVLCSGFIAALRDYTMIIVAVTFLAAGISACLVSGMKAKKLGKCFISGVVGILPAVLMIMMASSIRYTMEEAGIMDTVLHGAVGLAENLPSWTVILFIYLIVLVMNFFIPSGSAKAFMLIPIIVPMAKVFGVSPQLCVLAFAFGDGFSNVFYPTNPALLISLGLADISYGKWFAHSVKFQAANLVLTSILLLFGLAVGY